MGPGAITWSASRQALLAGARGDEGCEAEGVPEAIIEAATDNEPVVLGATRERAIRALVVGSGSEAVGERTAAPVTIAKRRFY